MTAKLTYHKVTNLTKFIPDSKPNQSYSWQQT